MLCFSCRCVFCLRVNQTECAVELKRKSEGWKFSSACPMKPSMKYASALKGSDGAPCTNINVVCPEKGCDAVPHYTRVHGGMLVTQRLRDLRPLMFQPKDTLSAEEMQRVNELLSLLEPPALKEVLTKISKFLLL